MRGSFVVLVNPPPPPHPSDMREFIINRQLFFHNIPVHIKLVCKNSPILACPRYIFPEEMRSKPVPDLYLQEKWGRSLSQMYLPRRNEEKACPRYISPGEMRSQPFPDISLQEKWGASLSQIYLHKRNEQPACPRYISTGEMRSKPVPHISTQEKWGAYKCTVSHQFLTYESFSSWQGARRRWRARSPHLSFPRRPSPSRWECGTPGHSSSPCPH